MKNFTAFLTVCMVIGALAFFGCGESTGDESGVCPSGGVFLTMVDSSYTVGRGAVLSGNPAINPCIPGVKLSGDPMTARYYNGKIYVVNSRDAHNIQILDPARNYTTVAQYSTDELMGADGTYPQDIAFASPQKAYISLQSSGKLLIMNPANGNKLGTIDLSQYADDDGVPEAAKMLKVQDRLFVTLQLLDSTGLFMLPTGPGKIVVIDTSNDAPASSIQLDCENPFTDLYYDETDSKIYVGCAGEWGNIGYGGVEAIDVDIQNDNYSPAGTIFAGSALGGNIGSLAPASSTSAYAVVSDDGFTNHLVEFNLRDPAAGVTDVWAASGYVPSIAVDSNGYLYLADQNAANPGIRVWDTSTNTPIAGPIDVGMMPYALAVME